MVRIKTYLRDLAGERPTSRDAWERLSLYESRDLLGKRYRQRHQREANDAICREIASHLLQGRQWFASARDAGELVRPLLLYYGVVAFSRGLVLFLRPGLREATLKPSHGVEALKWSNELGGGNGGSRRIPDLRLRLEKGTFSQLTEATANDEQTTIAQFSGPTSATWGSIEGSAPTVSSIGWIASGTPSYPTDTALAVRDVLGRLPDLAHLYEQTFDEPTKCVRADIAVIKEGTNLGPNVPPQVTKTWIDLYKTHKDLPPIAEIATALGLAPDGLPKRYSFAPQDDQVALAHKSLDDLKNRLPPVRTDLHGSNFLVAPLPDRLVLSSMSLLFLAAFSTGTLVRYHPTAWQAMSTLHAGDQAFPLLKAAVSLVERRFPVEVLGRLEREPSADTAMEQRDPSRVST